MEPDDVAPVRRRWWEFRRSRTKWIVTGVSVVYGGPPAAYGWLVYFGVVDPAQWGEFFKTVATPYGTVTAGVAALGAAGITLHNGTKQRESERARADDELEIERRKLETTWADSDRAHEASVVRDLRARFTTATEQLANPNMTTQQAGAYALGSLADDWLSLPNPNVQEAQVCVDILCTYLRTHHHAAARADGRPAGDDYDYTVAPADQPVRDSIQRILTNHLRDGEKPETWSALDFDLTRAHLHGWGVTDTHFAGTTRFNGAHFTGTTDFNRAHFTGTTWFVGAHFTNARFNDAHFTGTTGFIGAHFTGTTDFGGVDFTGTTDFGGVDFAGTTGFIGAQFIAGETRFAVPSTWEDVSVDWDESGDVPEHVSPKEWPPRMMSPD